MMIIPRFPSEPNKKPHLVKLDRVNNNYNKLKIQFSDRIFQLISQKFGVVGQNTSKITRRAPAKTAQLINDKDIT